MSQLQKSRLGSRRLIICDLQVTRKQTLTQTKVCGWDMPPFNLRLLQLPQILLKNSYLVTLIFGRGNHHYFSGYCGIPGDKAQLGIGERFLSMHIGITHQLQYLLGFPIIFKLNFQLIVYISKPANTTVLSSSNLTSRIY